MLNDYHRQFLRHALRCNCRFLLIGGQALLLQGGRPTRDLDILVDISPANRQPLLFTLRFWKSAHPLHSMVNFDGPLDLRPNFQIKFPDGEGCGYATSLGTVALIDVADGIDILTSLKSATFEDFYSRSLAWDFEGHILRMLCRDDLDETRKSETAAEIS